MTVFAPQSEFDDIESVVRSTADSLEVSRDLRHRVLDRAYWAERDDCAWWKLLVLCVVVTMCLNAGSLLPCCYDQVDESRLATVEGLAMPWAYQEEPRRLLTWSGTIPRAAAGSAWASASSAK